jgi:hypothetical protein
MVAAMRLTKPNKIDLIVIGVIIVILVALLVPTGEAVGDGHFQLTIETQEDEPIDRDSLVFVICWFEHEAEHALATPGLYEYGCPQPTFTDDGHAVIDVPYSIRLGSWRTADTYNHPEYLVVEYRPAAPDNGPLKRKRFDIQPGRGSRSLAITLP